MNFLPVPKLLKWEPSIPQHYTTDKKVLVVSGCSFTANTLQTEFASSWPGFVVDRCGFDHAWDWSFPGAGNEYIGDSIIQHFEKVNHPEEHLAIVMWSGLDRLEVKQPGLGREPQLRGVTYTKVHDTPTDESKRLGTQRSADKILEVHNYLTQRGISFVFTMYSNLLFLPYIPKRDGTPEFDRYLDRERLTKLRAIDWIPNKPMDFLYEFGFKNDMLAEDMFHPGPKCSDRWTDEILLVELAKRGLIEYKSN